jgi:predicted PurR-regulated permease PerM
MPTRGRRGRAKGGQAQVADDRSEPPATPPGTPVETSSGSRSQIPEWAGKLVYRSIWQLISAVLITLVAIWALHQTRDLVRYLFLSLLLSFCIEPAVIYLHDKRGWRRGSATGLILLAVFVGIVIMTLVIGAALVKGANGIVTSLPHWIDSLNSWAQEHLHVTPISESSASSSTEAAKNTQSYLSEHAGDILGTVSSALSVVFSIFTVGMFTFYMTANGDKMRRAICSRMPPERQRRVLWAWEESIKKMGGYLYSRGALAAINGSLMFLTLTIVGTPYAAPLALFEGIVAEFIPIVGTYIAGAVPVLVTLATVGLGPALVVLAEILAYQQLENYVLSPRISAKTMQLNAGVAFGAAMAGGALGGFIGAFFGLPIAAVIQSFISTYGKHYDVVEQKLTHVDAPPPPKPKKEHKLLHRKRGPGHEEPVVTAET